MDKCMISKNCYMKFRLFLISAIAGMFPVSCAVKEIPSVEGTVKAVMENDQTRTSVTDEGSFTWSAGDQVWLHTTAGGIVGTLSSGAGTASANFDFGAFFGEMTGKAVYPYNSGHSVSGNELDVVLPASYDLGGDLSNTNAAMYGENMNGKIMFNHLAGVMRFKFRNVPAGTDRFQLTLDKKINGIFKADLTDDYPVIQTEVTDVAAEKTITLNFDALTEASDIALYVPLPLGTYATLALDLWAGDQSVWTYSNAVTNTVGRKSLILMPAVNMGGTVDGEIDEDYSSEYDGPVDLDLSEEGYANSYIVSAAGTYRFKPTRGSSLKFITDISSVEVYWESFGTDVVPSVGDLIRNPKYEDGYISFETPDNFKEGNAVIAAKNANGTILWSWHIWLTDKPQEYVCVDDAGITMDRNLGATSAVPGEVGALGLMYEWGRKDPFLGSSSIDTPKVAKATNTWFDISCSDMSTGSIEFSIMNPMTFITEGNYNDWLYYDNYYQIDHTRWGEAKTIYDPCPSGWKVPDMAFYHNAKFHTETNQSDTDKCGRKFSGAGKEIWYPNTGQLTSYDSFKYFNYGLYWTSTAPQSNTSAWFDSFYFSSTFVDYAGVFEAGRAQAVRCIKDESSNVY